MALIDMMNERIVMPVQYPAATIHSFAAFDRG